MATREVRHEINALKRDLDRLQDDLRQISRRGGSAVRATTSDAVEQVKGAAANVLEEGTERAKALMSDAGGLVREKGHDVAEGVKHQIEERPLASVLLTLGVGFALGLLLMWRRS